MELDSYLDEPFRKMHEDQHRDLLARMDCMIERLTQMEHDLDRVLDGAAVPAGSGVIAATHR